MGINYGDHLIDSGDGDITPEQEAELDREDLIAKLWNENAELLKQRDDYQARVIPAETQVVTLEHRLLEVGETVERAYGLLWLDSTRSVKVFEARMQLLSALDTGGQRRAIEYVTSLYGPATDAEIALMEEPLTDVQRSVRDGTFGVRSENSALGADNPDQNSLRSEFEG